MKREKEPETLQEWLNDVSRLMFQYDEDIENLRDRVRSLESQLDKVRNAYADEEDY